MVIDLRSTPGWQDVVRRAKNLPHFRTIPIVAFGSHVDVQGLAAARAAGCDHAWARSRFMEELPALVERALHPPLRDVSGCDEPPPPLLLKGLEQFNAGEYWECHETLETLWRDEPRPVRDLYQGVLQIGVAFHHLRARTTIRAFSSSCGVGCPACADSRPCARACRWPSSRKRRSPSTGK